MNSKKVSLKVSDGTEMGAYISIPEGKGPFPGVIVFQEAFGVSGHIRSVTDKIAKEGFVAIAPELFHRTLPGFPQTGAFAELGYTDFTVIRPHIEAITPDMLTADIKASHEWLVNQAEVIKDKIGTIGFCLGGRVSFVANTVIPVSASISYYGSGIPALLEKAANLHAPHLFFWGGLDKHIGQDQIDAVMAGMKNAGKPFINTVISYADHGFNNDDKAAYNADASKEAWAMSMAFFRNKLSPS